MPILFLSSGQPLNVVTGGDDNGDTIFNDRPPGVGRNTERTSGYSQLDLGIMRMFRVGRVGIQAPGRDLQPVQHHELLRVLQLRRERRPSR